MSEENNKKVEKKVVRHKIELDQNTAFVIFVVVFMASITLMAIFGQQ